MNSIYLYKQKHDKKHVISIGKTNNLLTTPGGNLIASSNEEVISNIIYDLQRYEDIELDENDSIIGAPMETLTSYALLSAEIDFWSGDERLESEEIEARLGKLMDPLTNLFPGPEQVDQLHQWRSVIDFLETFGYNFMELQYFSNDKKQINFLANQISEDFNSGNRSEKSVFINILTIFGSPILSWSFCFHRLSEVEIASALIETVDFQFSLTESISDELENHNTGNNAKNPSDSNDVLVKRIRNKKKKEQFDEVVQILYLCRNYININTEVTQDDIYYAVIDNGETKNIEFKSTFSMNLKNISQNKDKNVEKSSIKTLAGYLNTDGGELYIGVDDDGQILGIDQEIKHFHNKKGLDGLKLYLMSQLNNLLGKSVVAGYIEIKLHTFKEENKTILIAKCGKSEEGVFFDKSVFYIRQDPQTQKLEGTEMLDYIEQRKKSFNK